MVSKMQTILNSIKKVLGSLFCPPSNKGTIAMVNSILINYFLLVFYLISLQNFFENLFYFTSLQKSFYFTSPHKRRGKKIIH